MCGTETKKFKPQQHCCRYKGVGFAYGDDLSEACGISCKLGVFMACGKVVTSFGHQHKDSAEQRLDEHLEPGHSLCSNVMQAEAFNPQSSQIEGSLLSRVDYCVVS